MDVYMAVCPLVFYYEDVSEYCLDVTLHQPYSTVRSRAKSDRQFDMVF